MKITPLKAQKRTVFGRKVKTLRLQNLIPANVFGKGVESTALEIQKDAFLKTFKETGETGLIELSFNDHKVPVLIHNLQVHSVTQGPLHVDFYQVNLKEKVKAKVPVEVVGEAPAVSGKIGILLTLLDEVEVEALPAEIPEQLEADVKGLSEVGHSLKASQLTLPSGVVLLTDGEAEVVRIDTLVQKEEEVVAPAPADVVVGEAGESTQAPGETGEVATAAKAGAPAEKTDKKDKAE